MPLSNETIDASQVPAGKTQLKLSDGGGLYILVKESGRYWKLAYRFSGKQKSLSLGVYPNVSLAMARNKRDEAKQWLAQGIDPGELKKQQKNDRRLPLLAAAIPQHTEAAAKDSEQGSDTPTAKTPQTRILEQPQSMQLEKRRLTILQRLSATKNFVNDALSLQEELDEQGFKISYDRMRTDLAWLDEQGVIHLKTGELWLATLTQAGMDVVANRLWVPGIMRPSSA